MAVLNTSHHCHHRR